MDKQDLYDKLSELEIRINTRCKRLNSLLGVLRVMIEEENFFPEVIAKEIDSLESLINK